MLPNAVKDSITPSATITWYKDTQSDSSIVREALVLTGASLTGTIESIDGTTRAIAGTLAVSDGANGIFTWTYDADDVSEAGIFEVVFTANFGAGIIAKSYRMEWEVKA